MKQITLKKNLTSGLIAFILGVVLYAAKEMTETRRIVDWSFRFNHWFEHDGSYPHSGQTFSCFHKSKWQRPRKCVLFSTHFFCYHFHRDFC